MSKLFLSWGKVSGFFYYFPLLFHKCSIFTTSKMNRQLLRQIVCWDVSRKSWANSFLSLHGQGFRILFYYFPLLFHKCSIFTTSKMDRQLSQQKVRQRISVFPENWHFHSHFVLKTTKTPVFVFVTEILWGNFLFNNWQSFFDFVKLLCYSASRGGWIHLYNLFCPSPFRLILIL